MGPLCDVMWCDVTWPGLWRGAGGFSPQRNPPPLCRWKKTAEGGGGGGWQTTRAEHLYRRCWTDRTRLWTLNERVAPFIIPLPRDGGGDAKAVKTPKALRALCATSRGMPSSRRGEQRGAWAALLLLLASISISTTMAGKVRGGCFTEYSPVQLMSKLHHCVGCMEIMVRFLNSEVTNVQKHPRGGALCQHS